MRALVTNELANRGMHGIVRRDRGFVAPPVAANPLPSHGGVDGAVDSAVLTRAGALAALLADPEVRRGVGSAWPLYLLLVLQWNGSASGTREEIGERMHEDGRNVGNWIAALERAGIVNVEKMGRRMTVTLTGAHMAAARIADPVVTTEVTESVEDDPALAKLVTMYKAAKAAGAKMRLLTESEFDGGIPA